ncbi:LAME_0H15676g1_1 [Lachancea meyersii CBS 8951]|uniref:LAME_0H15676g1_1 n=1 Tax=Lachancea meyersii CBS 8951 TaxID=1266667 RepID=A0A1G4KHQ7_9SACH|nr:LAME_0H15676g1_1 [Lachancea meyersii CBS 8951]
MSSPTPAIFREEFGCDSPFADIPLTPQRMNCIIEEESTKEGHKDTLRTLETGEKNTPQRPLSFYSAAGGNNSSNSLIANPSFSFGGNNNASQDNNATNGKRNSLKYVPGPKLPPLSSRSKSPVRLNRSPSPDSSKRRSSIVLEKPFNFSSSTLQPPNSGGSATRASFRKGHRYKHSSVSMNFFQEPEVKIPLSIAKSLPIPDFADLRSNIQWPSGYVKLTLVALQSLTCITTFHLGRSKNWSNFITLSHLVLYDVIGSLAVVLVENLSHFQVWNTGTVKFPFGLNRVDLLLSFALAISLCFMGLDLFFHILEETIAIFVESTDHDQHDEIAPKIPHSHHNQLLPRTSADSRLWYGVLVPTLVFSLLTLFKIFQSNTHARFKIKNPLITCTYILYLVLLPGISKITSSSDYFATGLLSVLIMTYGWKIAKWTSTVLLMGFSTASLNGLMLDNIDHSADILTPTYEVSRSPSTLPKMAFGGMEKSMPCDPSVVKSKLKESIEELADFRANCRLAYEDLTIIKINFEQYIVLMKIHMSGGSNDDELSLRISVDKCLRKFLKSVETTIDIDRL